MNTTTVTTPSERRQLGAMDSDTRTEGERAADERAIRALHGRVLEAWGAGDGEAFAAPFSDDALFIGFDGSLMRGREQIAATHQEVFDRWMKGTQLVEERCPLARPPFVSDETVERWTRKGY
jgi:uncharacterized protein (TIGR02246 family)